MEAIAAGPGLHRNFCTKSPAGLGNETRGDDFDFLDRVGRRINHDVPKGLPRVIGSIQREVSAAYRLAVDRIFAPAAGVHCLNAHLSKRGVCAWGQQNDVAH